MTKVENVINYYVTCNKLKNLIRTGWKDWNVQKERLESVAEHVYGVQMLAIAMKYEYNYEIDLMKVIMMLAVHELEETVIGDYTLFQISKEEKQELGHEAVKKILSNINSGEELEKLILEFDEGKTKEAKFAFYCDKLEADLQCKLYDEGGYVDLSKQEGNAITNDKGVQELLDKGMTWSQMWLTFGQRRYNYDENFLEVSNYAFNNKITEE